jgi:hypothetical protein
MNKRGNINKIGIFHSIIAMESGTNLQRAKNGNAHSRIVIES